ncbi:rab-GTPase-TBC domain-containing protein [Fimicolochytrium jonesii]|uniref:rab-GTPase-TBC domain-containing protein n=1 Tax=Fimicolochytrium jonesii TaxID=1396493 RepID=UPI0022FEB943|nr:rab-GTPase-TBC domain-containing protein [Fimicolochytrium jonesii]KAI8819402.1 rab-GTPase-TBC domain-containing protein [Fimicolochytrium jonesii]
MAESAAVSRPVDEYGFFIKEGNAANPSIHRRKSSFNRGKMNVPAKESAWLAMLAKWEKGHKKKEKKIKKLARQGVPESIRAQVWSATAGVDRFRKPGVWEACLEKTDETIFEVIERDIGRCFPEHQMFADPQGAGQENLRRVLRAFAVYKPEVGYCQGMGMIAGMMLMHMPAEDAFWLLVTTLETTFKDTYTPELLQLRRDAAVFEALLDKKLRPVARHMAKQDVTPLMYITQWFMTAFTTTAPWETTLRIWDMMFCEGIKPLFRAGLAIIKINKEQLLKECPTNAETIDLLLHVPRANLQADDLVAESLNIKIKTKDINKLRARVAALDTPDKGAPTLLKKRR